MSREMSAEQHRLLALLRADQDFARFEREQLEHHEAELEDVRIHFVAAGPKDGPLVILLHGFPEFWYCWRNQIPALAAAGFRVIAPDMRGYNRSSRPGDLRSYGADYLSRDVAALIQHLDRPAASVIGHDWGAAVAWLFAMRYPNLLGRLAILNGPHPGAFRWQMLSNPLQALMSWYVWAFQIPGLPERWIARNDYSALRKIFRVDPIRPAAFSAADIERNIAAISQPGALTAALNYYRAAIRGLGADEVPMRARVDAPVRVIWGLKDRYLLPAVARVPASLAPRLELVPVPEASHWVQIDQPEAVNRALLDFFAPDLPLPPA